MNTIGSIRGCGVVLACALATMPAAGQVPTVHWARIDNGCRGLVATTNVPPLIGCGAYGAFLFGDAAVELDVEPACSLAGGSDQPARYHREAPAPAASPGQWEPCPRGACFQPIQVDQTPVVVLDWHDGHGWSVGETLLQASDRRTTASLLDLFGARDRLPALGPRVTDVDLLAQLCAVAEEVYRDPSSRPAAINMSFGRVPREGPACDGPKDGRIECQVRGVLDHLYYDLDVVPVAAAGNHSELLFPASHPAVLSAGALDLAHFGAWDRQVQPSMETPAEAEALVVGYGLYLQNPAAATDLWPAPAGSSYASALVAGWIAGSLGRDDGFRSQGYDTSGQWRPVAYGAGFGLAFNGQPIPGSDLAGPNAMLARATGKLLEPGCWTAPLEARRAVAVGSLVQELPELSVVDLEIDGGPLPGSRPCIPCQGEEPPPPDPLLPGGDVQLDLQAAAPLPQGLALQQLYLRAGPRVYRLEPLEGTLEELREAFATGRLEQLLVTDLRTVAGVEEQISLLFTVTVGGEPPEAWDAVPIAVHDMEGAPPCDDLGPEAAP